MADAVDAMLVEIVAGGDDEAAPPELAHRSGDLPLIISAIAPPVAQHHELQRPSAGRAQGRGRGARRDGGRAIGQHFTPRRTKQGSHRAAISTDGIDRP